MAFSKGDHAVYTQGGVDQLVQVVANERDGKVQIKNKGTFSPCPVANLARPFVLADPKGKHVDSGGPIFVQPDGQTTDDLKKAMIFKSPEDAEKFREGHTGIPYFQPTPFDDFVTSS